MEVSKAVFNNYIDSFSSLAGLGDGKRREMYEDFLRCKVTHLAEPMDYLKYGFYRLDERERAQYFTRREYASLSTWYNDPDEAEYIQDKARFIQTFYPFLGREALPVRSGEREHFLELYRKCDRLIYKPSAGGYGKGIRIFDTDLNVEEVWDELSEGGGIVEEVICQHPTTAAFHPDSVNTVRILSVIDEGGNVHIVAAAFRCGVGEAFTDNAGGVYATIDMDTGVICSDAASPFGQRYERHSDTGITFRGFRIPNWETLKEETKKAAQFVPKVRIVNWDWAIDAEGRPVVIEGNLEGGIGPLQLSSGLKEAVLALLK